MELSVQRMLMDISADLGLTIFGGDTSDAYEHLSAPNQTYLAVDGAHAD